MTYLAYFNHYNIRQCTAQYLDAFYRCLENLPLDTKYIINNDYLKKYNNCWRWEVGKVEQRWGNYDELFKRIKAENMLIMKKPEELVNSAAPSEILYRTVNEVIPTQKETILKAIEGNNINAGVTWVNNACFKETLEEFGIPVIHHELGPLRATTYISTAYMDFSGVNGSTEFNERFNEFLKIATEVPILSRKELLRIVSPENYRRLWEILENRDYTYDIGVGLQVEVDTNLLLYNNGYNWMDPILQARGETKKKVLVRPHPLAGFMMKSDGKLEIDDLKENAVEFINKCKKIYCLNSSVGFEAMLLGREAKIFGDSPFREMCNMNEDMKLKALNFAVFGYLIPMDLLFNDTYYKFRLANRGNEKAIYLDNMKRLLRNEKVVHLDTARKFFEKTK